MTAAPSPLDDLVEFLHRTRGVDFAGYKRASLQRRFAKRMAAVGAADHGAYLDYLQVHPEEYPVLFNTILINVTAFFRDPETWATLQRDLLPPLLAKRGNDAVVRAWSAGCASGEEPYTIAMALAEILGEDEVVRRVKIYATDMDEDALRHARQGIYSSKSVEALPDGLVDKYFTRAGESFELRKTLRRCVIFGRNDLVQDAPISRLDLLACRNTLMYMNAETQAKILSRLRFALNDGGILMLGKAEMILSHASTFTPLNFKRHIFTPIRGDGPIPISRSRVPVEGGGPTAPSVLGLAYDGGECPQLVVDTSGVLVLVNKTAREAFSIGGRDLGRPIQDLEVSYRPVNLRSLIDQVHADGRATELKNVERPGLVPTFFDVRVAPLRSRSTMVGVLITFVDVTETSQLRRELRHANQEVETAYAELQSTGEELETTNEELQSTVEELETTNEELHSTNEELETTNEELQSANDELRSVNDALGTQSTTARQQSVFLEAILATLKAAVIVVDAEKRVELWNRRAEELWGLRHEEVRGKVLSQLDIGLPAEELNGTIDACFAATEPRDVVLTAMNRRGKEMRCHVSCTRLDGDAVARGSVLVITVMDAEPGRGGGASDEG